MEAYDITTMDRTIPPRSKIQGSFLFSSKVIKYIFAIKSFKDACIMSHDILRKEINKNHTKIVGTIE